MYARESFTIAEVADLLSIRRLSDSYQDEFPVECPFCGDLRGKCSFCICKNGELKNEIDIPHSLNFIHTITLSTLQHIGLLSAKEFKKQKQELQIHVDEIIAMFRVYLTA